MHGTLLPEHDVVVIDEAHQLEEVVSATSGIALAPSRFRFLARALRSVIVDPELVASLDDMADRWAEAIRPHLGERLSSPLPEDLADALALARGRIERASAAVSSVPGDAPESVLTRKARAQKAVLAVFEAVDIVADVPSTSVAWVEGTPDAPQARGRADRREGGAGPGALATAHRRAHERDAAAHAADPSRSPFGHRRSDRRRQPVRLRGARAALLRGASARPPTPGLRSRAARRARRARSTQRRVARSRCSRRGARCRPPPPRCASASGTRSSLRATCRSRGC